MAAQPNDKVMMAMLMHSYKKTVQFWVGHRTAAVSMKQASAAAADYSSLSGRTRWSYVDCSLLDRSLQSWYQITTRRWFNSRMHHNHVWSVTIFWSAFLPTDFVDENFHTSCFWLLPVGFICSFFYNNSVGYKIYYPALLSCEIQKRHHLKIPQKYAILW